MSGSWLGDFREDAIVDFKWSTANASGTAITRSTNGTIRVYKNNIAGTGSNTVVGITDAEDFEGILGIHHCTVNCEADAFYTPASEYAVVLNDAVVDSIAVNAVIGHFSIENRTIGYMSNAAVQNIHSEPMTEDYAGNNTIMTLRQAFYMVVSAINQFDITGTVITTRKIDGAAAAMDIELDSATDPTSRRRKPSP